MSNVEILKEEHVPLKSRLWLSSADGGVGLLQTFIGGGALTFYFTNNRGLDLGLSAIVWIIFGIWNMINDPLFGYISDRTKNKLGRRIPYIRYGGPIIGLSYVLCWISYPGSDQLGMFFQFLIFLFLYDTLYTAVATSLYIMPYEMAVSNKARGSIFIWKIIFAILVLLISLVISNIKPGAGEDTTVYQIFHITSGVVIGVIVFASSFFYKENQYVQKENSVPFLESLKNTFKNKSFLIFEVLSFTVIFVQAALMTGLFYYLDEVDTNALFLFGFMFIGIIIGVYLFILKQDKLGVKKSMQIMTLAFSLGCFIILIFGKILILTSIGFLGIGIGFVGGFYLIPLMNGDVIDKDEDITGQRREGMYAGVNSFVTKYGISLANAIILLIMLGFGYIQNEPDKGIIMLPGSQSDMAELGIIIGWMLIPTILLFVCFIVMKWYPLAGSEWMETKKRLEEVHKQKEKEVLEKHGFKQT